MTKEYGSFGSIEKTRTIDVEKLSTQGTYNVLRDSIFFKDYKNKQIAEICPDKIFEQMKNSSIKKIRASTKINDDLLHERSGLLHKMKKLSKQLRLSDETYYLAIFYMDKILYNSEEIVNITLEKIALGCLSLAIKFYECDEDENLPELKEIAEMFFAPNINPEILDIKSLEFFCLSKLEYKLNLATPLMGVDFMIYNGISFNDDKNIMGLKTYRNGKSDSAYKLGKDIIDILIEDFSYFHFSLVHVWCSCIAVIREILNDDTLWCDNLENKYKIKLIDLLTCVDYVKSKYFKYKNSLRKEFSPYKSYKALKTMATCESNSNLSISSPQLNKKYVLSKTNSLESLRPIAESNLKIDKTFSKIDQLNKQEINRDLNKRNFSPASSVILDISKITIKRNLIPVKKVLNNKKDIPIPMPIQSSTRESRFTERRFERSKNKDTPFSVDKLEAHDSKYFEKIYNNMRINTMFNSVSRSKNNSILSRKSSNDQKNSTKNRTILQSANKTQRKNKSDQDDRYNIQNIRKSARKGTVTALSGKLKKKEPCISNQMNLANYNHNDKIQILCNRLSYTKEDRKKILAKLEIIKKKQKALSKH